MKVNVKIKRLNVAAVIPQYAHEYDAGVDLVATEDIIVEPGATVKVPTGISISLPPHFEAQVRPRSGITLKTKLRVALGTIDAGYVGEIGVIIDNIASFHYELEGAFDKTYEPLGVDGNLIKEAPKKHFLNTYLIRKGDRIAQLVFNGVESAHFQEVAQLSETTRGTGGFGSSGVKA
jgi:dUTP pyrophosphatase